MIERSIEVLKEMFSYNKIIGNTFTIIRGVSIDTRSIQRGNLYVPIIGERFDGHEFVQDAIEKGAAALLWNKSIPIPTDISIPIVLVADTLKAIQELAASYRRQLDIKVVGITGSNGKTSTKDILSTLLNKKFRTHKTYGNLNNHLGVPLTFLSMPEDTQIGVIEMGMSSLGEIHVLTQIANPDIAIITNIGEAHLEDLKNKDNIIKAKLEIIDGLVEEGLLIVNGDDLALIKATKQVYQGNVITFGVQEGNTYQAIFGEMSKKGLYFRLKEISESFYVPLLGKHQMMNTAAAIAAAKYLGMSYKDIKEALSAVILTQARNEIIEHGTFTILNDAYKSNPTSLAAALSTLYNLEGYSQKIVLLGDMNGLGDQGIQFHREIGQNLNPEKIDYVVTIGHLAEVLGEEARKKFGVERVILCSNKNEALEAIRKKMLINAIVLIKGSREVALEDIVIALDEERTEVK